VTGVLLALPVVGLVALPHILPLRLVAPVKASTIWLLALVLRALVAVGAVIFAFMYLPQTALFEALLSLCWHAVTPLVSSLELSGHPFADAALLLPGLALGASALWVVLGTARGWLALRSYVAERLLGEGPLGSSIVQDDDVMIAIARVGRARVMVSDVALDVMDDEELEAGLTHELGHARRRHRPVLVAASILAALGRLLPGTAAAERALALSLERDADEYAIRQTRNPLALASAICKAAAFSRSHPAAIALGGRGAVTIRLEPLLHGGVQRGSAALERLAGALALVMSCAVLGISFLLPAWAAAAPGPSDAPSHTSSTCVQEAAPPPGARG
jgi:Zn-dependent protease with chaperone function